VAQEPAAPDRLQVVNFRQRRRPGLASLVILTIGFLAAFVWLGGALFATEQGKSPEPSAAASGREEQLTPSSIQGFRRDGAESLGPREVGRRSARNCEH